MLQVSDSRPMDSSVNTERDNDPSEFYALVAGAADATLDFPVDENTEGPFWSEDGELDLTRCKAREREEVGVVPLGSNRYRLAERQMGPFSVLRLNWGDEFNADRGTDGTLRLTSVCMPKRYTHVHLFVGRGFTGEYEFVRRLHALGGGWELVAGGMLTLTIPRPHAAEFLRVLRAGGFDTPA